MEDSAGSIGVSGVGVYVLWLPKHSNVQRRPLGNRRISSVVTARMSKDARQSKKEAIGQDWAGQSRAGQGRAATAPWDSARQRRIRIISQNL